jgi:hypothetical protein
MSDRSVNSATPQRSACVVRIVNETAPVPYVGALHGFSRCLHLGTQRDADVGAQHKPQMVRRMPVTRAAKRWGTAQPGQDLGGRHRQR